jgi:transcriptional regulator with PAS, ATPase and Fis domain
LAFSRAGTGIRVEDLGSRNGTWVDGERLNQGEPADVRDGSIVRIGQTIFVVRRALSGADQPSAPMGRLVSPYGFRLVEEEVERIIDSNARNVLIEGETGTGKELIAELLHERLRPGKPRSAVNVAALPSGTIDAQLFGYVAGAYTGAGPGAQGLFLESHTGSLFLDELGELPLDLQPKLLRVLESGDVRPIGGKDRRVDVSVLAATHRSLDEMVEVGTFRRDLLARFAGARLSLPALRERPEDLYSVAGALLDRKLDLREVEVEAVERLMLHDWPANVRELRATLERVVRDEAGRGLKLRALEKVLPAEPVSARRSLTPSQVREALERAGGNQSQAARSLGITRAKLLRMLARQPKTQP